MWKNRTFKTSLFVHLFYALLLLLPGLALRPEAAQAASYGQVVISEIMYDPGGAEPEPNEWVELYNPTSAPIDISGWVLTDDSAFPAAANEGKCVIPAGTAAIPAMGFVVVARTTLTIPGATVVTCTATDGTNGYTFANNGDNLALFDADSAGANLIFGTLSLNASGSVDSGFYFPLLSGRNANISIGLKDPLVGWSGSATVNGAYAWALESPNSPGAANSGWTGNLTTPHTITLDGVVDTASEWQPGELLGSADGDPTFATPITTATIANGVKYYVTWDATHIYVGFIAPQIASDRQHYNVVVDMDPYDTGDDNAGLTGAPAANCNTSYETNGKADYAFAVSPTGGLAASQAVAGSWLSWAPVLSTAVISATNTQAEFRLSKSEIGLASDSQPIGFYLYVCNPGGNVVAAWPPENAINAGGAVSLTTRTVFDLTGSGRSPRTEAAHLGYDLQSIPNRSSGQLGYIATFFDAGGYYISGSNQNWYARMIVEGNTSLPTTDTCQVTMKVSANRLTSNAGGGIRRTYDITPVDCTGLFSRLSLKYEDGTGYVATDNDVSQTPSELRGLSENSMMLYHYTGGSWDIASGLTRNTDHNRVAHNSGAGTSSFSPWGFGYSNNAPTAVRLTRLSGETPVNFLFPVAVLLALLLVGVLKLLRLVPLRRVK
ncbi:MAG: lamin tail domain-containing protein [Chloroflexota bacterium]